MNYNEVINHFLYESEISISNSTGNLKIRGNKLIHFNTVIAEKIDNKILLNLTRYSMLTGKLQKDLKNIIPHSKIIEVYAVPGNYDKSLLDFVEKQD